MNFLIEADKSLFLFLNGIHSPFWDQVMWIVTAKETWYPLYAAILIWMYFRFRKASYVFMIFAVLSVVLSDLASVHLFKEVFCRLRPSHNTEFGDMVHVLNNYRGGSFGFVSSHAANSFAVAVFTLLVMKKRWYTVAILFWACLVSYSRIYAGVHYPADLAGGAMVGTVMAGLMYVSARKINARWVISGRSS